MHSSISHQIVLDRTNISINQTLSSDTHLPRLTAANCNHARHMGQVTTVCYTTVQTSYDYLSTTSKGRQSSTNRSILQGFQPIPGPGPVAGYISRLPADFWRTSGCRPRRIHTFDRNKARKTYSMLPIRTCRGSPPSWTAFNSSITGPPASLSSQQNPNRSVIRAQGGEGDTKQN